MPSQALLLTADLNPLQWILNGGPSHYANINHPATDKNIYCLGPYTTDRVRIATPTGIDDIGNLVSMDIVVKNNLVSTPPAGICGWRGRVYKSDGVSLLGEVKIPMTLNFAPHEYSRSIALSGSGSDVTSMIFEIYSMEWPGAPWAYGMGAIQTYQLLLTLVYEAATVAIRIDEVHAPIPAVRIVDAVIPAETEEEASVPSTRIVDAVIPSMVEVWAPIDSTRIT